MMNKVKAEVPLWAKPGKIIWYEIREPLDIEVEEYREAEVESCNYERRELTIKDLKLNKVVEARGDRIHEREQTHAIVNNLSDIPTLNDAELMKHLEVRYKNELIHCFCGLTLIVINPYKLIEREVAPATMEKILQFLADKKLADCFPHVWTVSAYAWNNLFSMNINQAVCISGESGAGKTESTKRCLEFIIQMKGTGTSVVSQPIEKKIMSCNPILEAFGNAKTIRNDNSSRFGKYTTLFVDKIKKSVKGAAVENYLLEKSRVTSIGEKERNYHIFYALCRFMPKDLLEKYELINNNGTCDMKHFNYLNQSIVYEDPKVNDLEFWTDVNSSLKVLGFSVGQQDGIWRSLAAILYIGNIKVDESGYQEGSKPCKIVRDNAWNKVISLLQTNPDLFEEALTHKELKVGGTSTKSPLQGSKVKNNIDTIAREIYNRMFNWIVCKINKNLLPPNPKSQNFQTIGVLDIFGFEIFTKNSIEQLFINFANERLQGLYIDYIFKNECKIFETEGLGEYTSLIVYKDNKHLLLALDNPKMPPGIFDLVDNTCALNKNDEYLHGDILKNHKNSPCISFPRIARGLVFMIKHTARDVEYSTDAFVEKNKDELSAFLQQAFETSQSDVVRIFNNLQEGEQKSDEEVKTNPKEKYLGYKFRRNMNVLVETLASCYCHFIRCIKPNEVKRQNFWDEKLALTQIRYMGLLDSLKIRKLSYPFRWAYEKFYQIFQDLDVGPSGAKRFTILTQNNANFRELDAELLKYCGVQFSEKDLLYGKTRIFLNERFKIDLDKALYEKQKVKRQALNLIGETFKTFQTKKEIRTFFIGYNRSILIARDLLKSWTAKIEGMEHKKYKKIVRRIQGNFRLVQKKRELRLQKSNMILVVKRLVLQKLAKQLTFVYYYKNKVSVMQAMIERKIRDSKNRICQDFVSSIFEVSWQEIVQKLRNNAVLDLQRTIRGMLNRRQKHEIVAEFGAKISESKEYNAAANIQRMIRGFLVRRKLLRLNKAARKIQGFMKMRWLRKYFLLIQRAAHVIGRFLKKMYIRKVKHKQNMLDFNFVYSDYTEKIVRLENDILFSEDSGLQQNLQSSPFSALKIEAGQKIVNYKSFIPPAKDIELNKNAKLMTILIDLNAHIDTSSIYQNSWAIEFSSFLRQTHEKGARLMHLEVGDSFTIAITDEKELYTWGSNDFNQCARDINSDSFSVPASKISALSDLNARVVSAGKEHSLIIDEFGKIQLWGKNVDGQFGVSRNRQAKLIHELTDIKATVQSAITKENINYVVTAEGKAYQWPRPNWGNKKEERIEELNFFKPIEISFGSSFKIQNVDAGSDYVVFLSTNGVVFSMGDNMFGELGLGDNKPRKTPTAISWFTDQNERIIEISAGHKHVLAQTLIGKIYSWGLNHDSQLGQGDSLNRSSPVRFLIPEYESLRVKVRNVQAGFNSSFVLLSDRIVYYSGVCNSQYQKPVKIPTRYNYEDKFFKSRNNDQFIPIRIYVKWSKTLSVVYIVYADLRQDSPQNLITTFNEKYVHKILNEWRDFDKQLFPPQDEILQKSINIKYLQRNFKNKAETSASKIDRSVNVQTFTKMNTTDKSKDKFETGDRQFKKNNIYDDGKQKEKQNNPFKNDHNQDRYILNEAQKSAPLIKKPDEMKAQKKNDDIKSNFQKVDKDKLEERAVNIGILSKSPIKSNKDAPKGTSPLIKKQAPTFQITETDLKKAPINVEPINKIKDEQEKDKLFESMLNLMKKKGTQPSKELDKSLIKIGKK